MITRQKSLNITMNKIMLIVTKIKQFFNELTNQRIKMNYYWFNRQEILRKAKERYSKEEAVEYYAQNKQAIKKVKREL